MSKASKARSMALSEPSCRPHVRAAPCDGDALFSARGSHSGNGLAVRRAFRLPVRGLLCLSMACCLGLAGCIAIPTGRHTGRPWLVAAHTNAVGVVDEQLFVRPTDHYVMMLISAEGPQLSYPWRTTWRYFMQSADGTMTELPFLRIVSPHASWHMIRPLPNTNEWIAAGSVLKDDFSARILVFNRLCVLRDRRLPGMHGEWRLDERGRELHYRTKGKEGWYDLPSDTLHMPSE